MEILFARLVTALERPRPLVPQVVRFLTDHFGLGREEIGLFLDERLGGLAEDELDLLLAPVFTPKLTDQAWVAASLGQTAVPVAEWSPLVAGLAARPTRGQLLDDAGTAHAFALQPVTLERYIHRLRLDGTVDDLTAQTIQSRVPATDRPLLLAIARRAIWNTPARREILRQLLDGLTEPVQAAADASELLKLMETSEPSDATDILARLPSWEEVLRGQIAGANQPKIFFNEQVRYLHGGGRDQRNPTPDATAGKLAELAFLGRLRQALAR